MKKSKGKFSLKNLKLKEKINIKNIISNIKEKQKDFTPWFLQHRYNSSCCCYCSGLESGDTGTAYQYSRVRSEQ